MEITNQNISEAIIPIEHSIVDGVYTRIAYAPANCIIVGCEHKQGGTAFLMQGSIRQIDGDLKYEISAPKIFNTEPGTQRVAYTLTDVIYATTHSTKASTVEEAEKELFIGESQLNRIRRSFNSLPIQIPKDTSTKQIDGNHDKSYYFDKSAIHGNGVFANKQFNIGDCIGMYKVKDTKFIIADYLNHSDIPNAILVKYKNSIAIVASKIIPERYEIFINYKELVCQ